MNVKIIIPARYESSRFPGKPLALINGKPMILHVAENCSKAFGKEAVVVATDHWEIVECVSDNGFDVCMTPRKGMLTGTDRVAFVANELDCDYVINVQGDEPLVNHEDIISVANTLKMHSCEVVNCYTEVEEHEAKFTKSIKVVTDDNGCDFDATSRLVYMSRSMVPHAPLNDVFKKQIGIYGFYRGVLLNYYGYNRPKHTIEAAEDIEILRLLNTRVRDGIYMLNLPNAKYQAVDIESDIKKVEAILRVKEFSNAKQ